jgi:hypothetical protein
MNFDRNEFYRIMKQIVKTLNGTYQVSKHGSWVGVTITLNDGRQLRAEGLGYYNATIELEKAYDTWKAEDRP